MFQTALQNFSEKMMQMQGILIVFHCELMNTRICAHAQKPSIKHFSYGMNYCALIAALLNIAQLFRLLSTDIEKEALYYFRCQYLLDVPPRLQHFFIILPIKIHCRTLEVPGRNLSMYRDIVCSNKQITDEFLRYVPTFTKYIQITWLLPDVVRLLCQNLINVRYYLFKKIVNI